MESSKQRQEPSEMHVCPECGKSFKFYVHLRKSGYSGIYCSRLCRVAAQTEIDPERTKVPLGKSGRYTLVSPQDYDKAMEKRWGLNKDGYAMSTSTVHEKTISLHRFLMHTAGTFTVDHINGDRLDNRRENLRFCTVKENGRNRRKTANPKSSQYKGVFWRTDRSIWVATIHAAGVYSRYIGSSHSEEDAARMYDAKAKALYGEFASLNFPE